MGCKDKIRDQRILAEIKRRKEAMIEEPVFEYLVLNGSLWELQFAGIEEERIVSITRERDEFLIN